MIKFSKILLLSGVFMCINTSAYSMDLNTTAWPENLNLNSNISSNSSYQLAALTWLPDLEGSEVGPTGSKWEGMSPKDKGCAGYPYTTENCNSNNREPLGERCYYNSKYYKSCGCNTSKYPISSTDCQYAGSLRSQKWLLGDDVCSDGRAGKASMYGKKCLCTSSNFRYTTKESCPAPQTVLDTVSSCTANGVTRYERCKCDTSTGQYDSTKDKGYGWDCNKCTDSYGDHYKCTPKPCVKGSTNVTNCGSNESLKDTGYKSGNETCYICEVKSNCGYFKNADGTINIPDSACSWDVYGHYATVNVPSGKNYSHTWIRMWGDSTVNGDFTTGILEPGLVVSNGGTYKQPRTITYKGRVTVTDTIRLEPGITTVKFEKGVCGNYKCEVWEAKSANTRVKVRDTQPGKDGCPVKASDCPNDCKNYFINSDGNITIPNGKCGWDAYGHTATITSGTPLNSEFETVWVRMWGPATIKNEIKTKNLTSGVVVSNVGSWNDPRTITFKNKVTISGELRTDPDVTTTKFEGGIYGNYICKRYKAGSGANKIEDLGIIQPGEKGCPCSMDRFTYDSSNCNGTLSGASCGGKYEKCEVSNDPCSGLGGVYCGGYDPYGTDKPTCMSADGKIEYAHGLNNGRTCWKCSEGYTLQCPTQDCLSKIKALGSNYYPITSGDELATNDNPDKYKATDVLVLMNDISVGFSQINSNVEPASKYCSNMTKSKLVGSGEGLAFKPKSNIQISVPVETANSMVVGNVTFNDTYKAQQLTISALQDFSTNVTATFKKPADINTLNVLNIGSGTVTFEDTLSVGSMETYDNKVVFKKGVTYK